MKNPFIILVLLFIGCQPAEPAYLLKTEDGEGRCGYVDAAGKPVVPVGKYQFCFTDTLRHFAAVIKPEGGCVAIDKTGKELFEIYWYDNGPDYFSDGLFRIKKDGKIGYADEQGKIVIAPQFACAEPFENGRARVALNCTLVPDGEMSVMESSEWFYIDKSGKKINE
ncbi:MAG: WG repeat-containing protein [Saprospiraceae bacterium]|nr:WG repeat-containing protein [Saprospiraceae bacterium]